jgi:SAM-dependent methyltransferase
MEHVPPRAMFDQYLYISSMSDTLTAHLHDLSRLITERYSLGPEDLVIDVGSNDGTLLSGFQRYGVRTLGVDPARNLAEMARRVGVETFTEYFGSDTAAQILQRWGKAAVITVTNTFLHIPHLADFLQGIDKVLADDGVLVIEAHYLMDLLEQVAFDTIYHEHVSYWALGPMANLFNRYGLQVVNVERLPLHHGQLRVFVQRHGHGSVLPVVDKILGLERTKKMDQFATYEGFARQTYQIKQDIQDTINGLLAQGKHLAGYGAPAKGNTLLNYLEIGPEKIDYIADRSPLKQKLYTPGMHILVVPPERLLEDQPDYVLLLAWNFAEEIMTQQAEYRRRGGKFIIPVPQVKIV